MTANSILVCLVFAGLAVACDKTRAPPKSKRAAANAAASAPESAEAPATLAVPDPSEPPLALPSGTTLGDALPPLPKAAPRLSTGDLSGAAVAAQSCADIAPAGFVLVKRYEITVPAGVKGAPPNVIETCILAKPAERKDKWSQAGKEFLAIATWPPDKQTQIVLPEMQRPAISLPPERQKAGHDATGWGTIVATGNPDMPALAIASARFFDGLYGEQVFFRRDARVLRSVAGALQWQPLEVRDFVTIDLDHLHNLCEGKAEASPADRAGPQPGACAKMEQLAESHAAGAQKRLDDREARLKGQGSEKVTAQEGDPQSIWLRDGRKALTAGDYATAADMALRVHAVCGEAAKPALALMSDVVAARHLTAARTQPNQTTADLCEPLPDKDPPKRPRAESKPETGGKKGREDRNERTP